MKKCIIENCNNEVESGWARWYCKQHYEELKGFREIRSGINHLLSLVLDDGKCSVASCKSKVESEGLCKKHLNALLKNNEKYKNKGKVCKNKNCNSSAVTDGLCEKCYSKKRLKNPEKKKKQKESIKKYHNSEKGQSKIAEGRGKRRTRKNNSANENFSVQEVFEECGWICGLCGKPVNKNLKYPHPESKSLDHILPLSRGGTHTKDNVQLAHLHCNLVKGNRIPDCP